MEIPRFVSGVRDSTLGFAREVREEVTEPLLWAAVRDFFPRRSLRSALGVVGFSMVVIASVGGGYLAGETIKVRPGQFPVSIPTATSRPVQNPEFWNRAVPTPSPTPLKAKPRP